MTKKPKKRKEAEKVLDRVVDKRPVRAPRRPAAARYEPGRRTGAKKRLGR